MTNEKEIKLGQIKISNKKPFVLIAGPCVLESREHALMMASELKNITDSLNLGFIITVRFRFSLEVSENESSISETLNESVGKLVVSNESGSFCNNLLLPIYVELRSFSVMFR